MARRPLPAKCHLLPEFIPPELATLVDKAPDGDGWVHEIKLDGYRTVGRIDHGEVRLLTRTGLDWTACFRLIAAALDELQVTTAYLDGEAWRRAQCASAIRERPKGMLAEVRACARMFRGRGAGRSRRIGQRRDPV